MAPDAEPNLAPEDSKSNSKQLIRTKTISLACHTVSCVLSNCYRVGYSVSGSRVVPPCCVYVQLGSFMGELSGGAYSSARGKPLVVQGLSNWFQVKGSHTQIWLQN